MASRSPFAPTGLTVVYGDNGSGKSEERGTRLGSV